MRFKYTVPVNEFPAICDIEQNGDVVIATELPENTGMSITNAAEWVAAQVCLSLNIDHHHLIWIEHYPADGMLEEDTYDLVEFEAHDPPSSGHIPETFSNPVWRPITSEEALKRIKQGK